MKTVIIGAGKLGFSIAKLLSGENQDVFLIEEDDERCSLVEDTLDVQVIQGNGASWHLLKEVGINEADMLVAVTETDELNMIACLLGKKMGVKTTVARVRNPEYMDIPYFSTEDMLGIDIIINPERVTADEIAKIVKNPEALSVEYYADGRVQMVEVQIPQYSHLDGKKLKELDTSQFVIVGIVKEHRMIIPGGEDQLHVGDRIYIMSNTAVMPEVLKYLGIMPRKVESLTILGAGRTGCYLAKIIEEKKWPIDIKIIEKDAKQARKTESILKHALIIHGDGADMDLLNAENIGESDMLISVTDDDKLNVLSCLMAKSIGVRETVCKVKRSELMPLMDQIGIDVVMNPRMLTAGAILKHIRQGEIVSVTVLGDEKSEMIELVAQPGSNAADKKLSKIKFPNGAVVGSIFRNGAVIIPSGDVEVKPGDRLMIFSLSKSIHRVERLFINGNNKKLKV